MWNKPEEIVEFLNRKYEAENWQLKHVRTLKGGYAGAILFLCQVKSNLHYVVVKSFSDVGVASK